MLLNASKAIGDRMKEYYELKYVDKNNDEYGNREITYRFYQEVLGDVLDHFKQFLLVTGFSEELINKIELKDDVREKLSDE